MEKQLNQTYGNEVYGFDAEASSKRAGALQEVERLYNYFSQKKAQYYEYDNLGDTLPNLERVKRRAMLVIGCILSTIGLYVVSQTESAFGVVVMLIGLALIGGFIAFEVKRKKQVQSVKERLENVENELTQHYQACANCQIGPEYTHPAVLERIHGLIQSGRADTIKEAINLMLSDLRMEEMAELQRVTAANAASAARSAKAGAAFSAASFFLKK